MRLRRETKLALPLVAVLAFGCSGIPRSEEAIPSLRSCDVVATGSIVFHGMEPIHETGDAIPSFDATRPLVRSHVRMWRAPVDEIDAMAPNALPGTAARVLDATASDELAARLDKITSPDRRVDANLELDHIRAGQIEAVRDVSHVETFEMRSLPSAVILDPKIGVQRLGTRLRIGADPVLNSRDLDLGVRIDVSESPRPFVDVEVPMLVADKSVHIEVPCLTRLQLSSTTRLARGEALLILSPSLGCPGEGYAILVEAAIVQDDGVATNDSAVSKATGG